MYGILPAIKITDPYSPTPRAKAKAKPVSKAGKMLGNIILVKTCRRVEPRLSISVEKYPPNSVE
jgi:hypothetical protein